MFPLAFQGTAQWAAHPQASLLHSKMQLSGVTQYLEIEKLLIQMCESQTDFLMITRGYHGGFLGEPCLPLKICDF